MSKLTDDNIEKATEPVVTPSAIAPEPDGEPASARMHRIQATVDKTGLNIIDRAVMLYLAERAILEPDSPALYGQALVSFAKIYVKSYALERDRR